MDGPPWASGHPIFAVMGVFLFFLEGLALIPICARPLAHPVHPDFFLADKETWLVLVILYPFRFSSLLCPGYILLYYIIYISHVYIEKLNFIVS